MAEITPRPHGYVVRFEGMVDLDEMKDFRFRLMDELAGIREPFVLALDVREFRFIAADAQAVLEQLLEDLPDHGLERLAALGISTAHAGLLCNIMVRADVMSAYQFFDLAYEEDWEAELEGWLCEPFEGQAA